ncbi:MAG: hypothetical protein ACXV8Y_17580, partial [Acidimicrobiia bacterium]
MAESIAVVFPGQGTQAPGMGAAWQDRPEWPMVVGRAEDALGEPVGRRGPQLPSGMAQGSHT